MLTEAILENLTANEKPVKKSDGGGLHIHIVPLGRKRWRLAYRFDGKQKTAEGGEWPEISPHRARVRRDELKQLIAQGKDPAEIRLELKFQEKAEGHLQDAGGGMARGAARVMVTALRQADRGPPAQRHLSRSRRNADPRGHVADDARGAATD